MGDVALAFPHERAVTTLARRFRANRRRGFVVCVGASEGVRARVEAALRERLDGGALVSTAIAKGVEDPWGVLLGARTGEAQVVSARVDGEVEDRVLRALDVRRELLQGEELALMLWVSLGGLEHFAAMAPNLWSYRSEVAWFLSHEDIETSTSVEIEEVPPEPSIEERLHQIDEELATKSTQRTQLLLRRAALLRLLNRWQETLSTLEQVRPGLALGGPEEQNWRTSWLTVLRGLDRVEEARRFVEEGRRPNAPKHRVLERIDVALMSTDWRGAFGRLEQAVASSFRWEGQTLEIALGPECLRAVDQLLLLGQLAQAERWLDEALKCIKRRVTNWWPMVLCGAEAHRAHVAWERLDAVAALRHQQRRWRLGERVGALDQQFWALDSIESSYAALGLADDRLLFEARAASAKELMHADPEPNAPLDTLPSRPVDTPFARLERAVYDAEHALDATPPTDAAPALDACAAAWSAEDPRYRSWRLFARWQQALARHLVARGDDERAVAGLRDAIEQLRDLPRTRLAALVALAKLPTGPDHHPAREAAAAEVLSQALDANAGALDLERDARRALAPIVRARGDEAEAAFHEAEADRIDAALAPTP